MGVYAAPGFLDFVDSACHRRLTVSYATRDTCHRLTVYATADTRHRLTVYATGPHFYLSRAKNFTHSNRTYQYGFSNPVHSIQAVTTHLLTPYLPLRG